MQSFLLFLPVLKLGDYIMKYEAFFFVGTLMAFFLFENVKLIADNKYIEWIFSY